MTGTRRAASGRADSAGTAGEGQRSSAACVAGATNSLTRDITRGFSAWAVLLTVAAAVALAVALYVVLDSRATANLTSQADALAATLNERAPATSPVQSLEDGLLVTSSDMRVTLIAADGTVLFDSQADAASLDNHALRPEVLGALETGQATTGRYSETIHQETIYHAERLGDGSVLRLAVTQASVWGVMAAVALPVAAVLAAGVIASWATGRRVSRRVASSLAGLDLDDPLSNDAPAELQPLLERLDDQRRRLDLQDAERRRFTSSASHELKTPLTVISGYAEIIDNGIAKPADVPKFAGLIHTEAQHMKSIVDDLLALSRLDDAASEQSSVELDERVSLTKVALGAVEQAEWSAERRDVALEAKGGIAPDGGDVYVTGNERMLGDLVKNLVENAVRYNVPGGTATVSVEVDEQGRPVLSVADTGIGIPPELREKVFERFFCVDESRSKSSGGSGLGLAIVKHAAQLHHATVRVMDNEPVGTVFVVTFPAAG